QRAVAVCAQPLGNTVELRVADAAGLVAPGPHGVETDRLDVLGLVDGLGRLPVALELRERSDEAGREAVRDVVIARNGEHGDAEAAQQSGRALVLVGAAAMRQVAARDQELRPRPLHQRAQRPLHRGLLPGARVEVRDVEDPCVHSRIRLYSELMADESTEIFDDVYLGLRAGGAAR